MDKREVLVKAISTGNCPFEMLDIGKNEWNCHKFDNCKECANTLIDRFLMEN